MKLTKQILLDGTNSNAISPTREQTEILGVQWPTRKGWTQKIIGKDYPKETIQRFLDAKKIRKPREKQKQKTKVKRLTKEQYRVSLLDKRWKQVRTRILFRDNYTCQKCGSNYKLHVHHEKYEGIYPWETSDEFLVTLCEECHKLKHPEHNTNEFVLDIDKVREYVNHTQQLLDKIKNILDIK